MFRDRETVCVPLEVERESDRVRPLRELDGVFGNVAEKLTENERLPVFGERVTETEIDRVAWNVTEAEGVAGIVKVGVLGLV